MIIQSLALIALVFASPARADVSDSGNLTIGGQGIIQGTMTVQGAGFSVGGTTFSVAGGSVTLGGRLNAAAAGIKWADGSTSTSASSGGSAPVFNATYTYAGNGETTTSTTFVSLPGSTVTLTMTGGHLRVAWECSAINDTANDCVGVGILVNGAYVERESPSVGLNWICMSTANRSIGVGINWLSPGTYTGSTSVSLVFAVDGTTGKINNTARAVCQLNVKEE